MTVGSFFALVVVALLFFYVPGYLLLRSLRVARLVSVVCAPLIAIPLYGVLTILYAGGGVFCSWVTLAVPLAALCGAAYVCSFFIGGKDRTHALVGGGFSKRRDWLCLALYVGLGVVVALFVFVRSLEDTASYVQDFDNIHHLGVTFGYIESGNWSPLHSTLYATADDVLVNPLPESAYYPAAWNWMAALLAGSTGASVPLAANVVNFTLVAVVFPSNVFLFLRLVFNSRPAIVPFGAFVTLGFAAFPWGFFTFGPLYPNMMAFCMIPSVAFCFVSLFEEGASRRSLAVLGGVFFAGLVCFVFSQPNAVFTTGVFLAPFCIYQVAGRVERLDLPRSRKRYVKLGLCAACVVAIALVWLLFYTAPFMQGVVTHSWPAFTTRSQALVDVLLLAFREQGTQVFLAVLVIAGGLYTLKERAYLWMTFSYAMMCAMYIIDVTSDAPIKFLMTGFWYTDSCRVAASAAIFAIPLAAMGLWLAARFLRKCLLTVSATSLQHCSIIAACAVAGVFLLSNVYPNFNISGFGTMRTGLGSVASTLSSKNSLQHPRMYDADEMAFVDEVKSVIPKGALVINVPDDGSVFSYGTQDVNLYYRYLRTYGEENETQDSKFIRGGLSWVATDDRVRAAVDRIGAEYVLVLDQGESDKERPRLFTYENGKNWKGLESIHDETPGFEVVLSRGDMRLYRILGPDELV